MIPVAFLGPGPIGTPVDVATFILVAVVLGIEVRDDLALLGAAVVALAERRDDVDDDRLRHELDVEPSAVEALRPCIVRDDGGEDAG